MSRSDYKLRNLSLSSNKVEVKGITGQGQLTLTNTNQNLSVMFEIQIFPPNIFQVEPYRGIIMMSEYKKIKIKKIQRNISGFLENKKITMVIHSTMNTQYNKKLMKKKNIFNLKEVENSNQTIEIPININNESYLRQSKRTDKQMYSSKDSRQSRPTSMQKFKQNIIKKSKISSSLSKELQFVYKQNQVLKKQPERQDRKSYQQLKSSSRLDNRKLDHRKLDNGTRSKQRQSNKNYPYNIKMNEQSEERKSSFISYHNSEVVKERQKDTAKERQYQKDIGKQHNQQRGIQIIIMAVISGFFVALGSNMAKLLS